VTDEGVDVVVWETDGGELGDMLGVTLSPTLALVFGSDTGPSKKSKKSSRKDERRRSLLSRSLLRLKTFPVLPSGLQLFFIFLAAIVQLSESLGEDATSCTREQWDAFEMKPIDGVSEDDFMSGVSIMPGQIVMTRMP